MDDDDTNNYNHGSWVLTTIYFEEFCLDKFYSLMWTNEQMNKPCFHKFLL